MALSLVRGDTLSPLDCSNGVRTKGSTYLQHATLVRRSGKQNVLAECSRMCNLTVLCNSTDSGAAWRSHGIVPLGQQQMPPILMLTAGSKPTAQSYFRLFYYSVLASIPLPTPPPHPAHRLIHSHTHNLCHTQAHSLAHTQSMSHTGSFTCTHTIYVTHRLIHSYTHNLCHTQVSMANDAPPNGRRGRQQCRRK